MKKTLLALAVASVATSSHVMAANHDKHSSVSVSGHVNYVAGDLEDFNGNDNITIRNGSSTGSRFRLVAKKEANGITYGIKQEFGLADGSGSPGQRVNEAYLKGGFGKFSLGQGSEAGDGFSEANYTGGYVLNSGSLGSWDVGDSSIDVNQIDGGRDKRIRYDSPKLGGMATIVVDLDDDGDTSLGVKLGGSMWQAALYTENRDADDSDEFAGSFAMKFGSGFNFYVQYGERDGEDSTRETLEFAAFAVGYSTGSHHVSVDLGTNEGDYSVTSGDPEVTTISALDSETIGLSYVYTPTKGVELYAGVRSFESKLDGGEDGNGAMIGTRVKF